MGGQQGRQRDERQGWNRNRSRTGHVITARAGRRWHSAAATRCRSGGGGRGCRRRGGGDGDSQLLASRAVAADPTDVVVHPGGVDGQTGGAGAQGGADLIGRGAGVEVCPRYFDHVVHPGQKIKN